MRKNIAVIFFKAIRELSSNKIQYYRKNLILLKLRKVSVYKFNLIKNTNL